MTHFIPHAPQVEEGTVPYFEESTELDVPGRGLTKDVQHYQNDVVAQLHRLGAGGIILVPGEYPGKPKRYGYRITFAAYNLPHRMDCAALPLRSETPRKKDRALAQALYIMARKLEAMVHAYIYEPGSMPLVPYMLGEGDRTVTEFLKEQRRLPTGEQSSGVIALPGPHE